MYLDPSEIRYSQDSIKNRFRHEAYVGERYIGDTLDQLCNGTIRVHDIPAISVMKRNGLWFTADNRRLWVFRNLKNLGKCTEVPVHETSYIDPGKLTTVNNGASVRVRGAPGGRWHYKSSDRITEPRRPQPVPVRTPSYIDSSSSYASLYSPGRNLFTSGGLYTNSSIFTNTVTRSHDCSLLDPDEVRFTKASIQSSCGVDSMIRVLSENEIAPMDILKAFKLYWAVDGNSKLLAFKEAKKTRPSIKIKAKVKEDKDKVLTALREDNPELSLLELLSFGKTITCV